MMLRCAVGCKAQSNRGRERDTVRKLSASLEGSRISLTQLNNVAIGDIDTESVRTRLGTARPSTPAVPSPRRRTDCCAQSSMWRSMTRRSESTPTGSEGVARSRRQSDPLPCPTACWP